MPSLCQDFLEVLWLEIEVFLRGHTLPQRQRSVYPLGDSSPTVANPLSLHEKALIDLIQGSHIGKDVKEPLNLGMTHWGVAVSGRT